MPRRRKKPPQAPATSAEVVTTNKHRQPYAATPANFIQQETMGFQSRFGIFAIAVPVLAALVASINSIANGFVYDDIGQVLNNRLIRKISNIPVMFTTSVWAFMNNQTVGADDFYYRPLFGCFLTACYALFGTTAWAWHLANITIRAGTD